MLPIRRGSGVVVENRQPVGLDSVQLEGFVKHWLEKKYKPRNFSNHVTYFIFNQRRGYG